MQRSIRLEYTAQLIDMPAGNELHGLPATLHNCLRDEHVPTSAFFLEQQPGVRLRVVLSVEVLPMVDI